MATSVGVQHEPKEWITLRPSARSSWLEHVARRWTASVVGPTPSHRFDPPPSSAHRSAGPAAAPDHGLRLLLGPPGCGKTHSVEALAEVLLGSPGALLKINCAEYQQQHEIARLVGAPPGYIGHADTEPVFTRENLERYRTPEFPYTLILFDEIEKAHHSLYSLLLGVLDRAEMNDGRNRHVDFSSCLFFFTSNIGSKESLRATTASGFIPQIGGGGCQGAALPQRVLARAQTPLSPRSSCAASRKPLSTIPLRPSDLKKILDLELAKASRVFLQHPTTPFQVEFSSGAKSLLLNHGCDTEYGAAHLQHTLACEFQDPLYRLMATGQVQRRRQDRRLRQRLGTRLSEELGGSPFRDDELARILPADEEGRRG